MRPRRALALTLPVLLLSAATPGVSEAAKARPAVVEKRVIGHTVKGDAIVAWRLGQPTATRKVVVLAAMHGNEKGPSRILGNLRDGKPVTGADIWVIPHYNRDGEAENTRKNAHGVDLNRNYPQNWVRTKGAYDSGPKAASEPETRTIMRFLKLVQPNFVISFHQPLFGVGRAPKKGNALVQRLHTGLHLPVKSFNCTGVCHGTMTEWYNAHFKGVAVTVEYGHGRQRQGGHQHRPQGDPDLGRGPPLNRCNAELLTLNKSHSAHSATKTPRYSGQPGGPGASYAEQRPAALQPVVTRCSGRWVRRTPLVQRQ